MGGGVWSELYYILNNKIDNSIDKFTFVRMWGLFVVVARNEVRSEFYYILNNKIDNSIDKSTSNQRNTNPDICHLQCRLFFFWSDAMAAAIAWGLNEKVKVSGIEIRSVRDRQ